VTPKKFLSQAQTALDKICELKKQIERLTDDMVRLTGGASFGERVQSSPPRDPMGDRVAKVADKIIAREKQLARWENVLYTVEGVLNDIECVTCSKILYKRYVEGLTLEEVADALNYKISYVRLLHTEGIREIKIPA